jgi:IS30 family transposase
MNTDFQQQEVELRYGLADLRRARVLRLLATGASQSDIARALGVDKSTISRDVQALRSSAQDDIKNYIESELPMQHKLAIAGLDEILKQSWQLCLKAEDIRTKLAALNIIGDTIVRKLAVMGDANQVELAIHAVAAIKERLQEKKQEDNPTAIRQGIREMEES